MVVVLLDNYYFRLKQLILCNSCYRIRKADFNSRVLDITFRTGRKVAKFSLQNTEKPTTPHESTAQKFSMGRSESNNFEEIWKFQFCVWLLARQTFQCKIVIFEFFYFIELAKLHIFAKLQVIKRSR